MYFNCLEQNLLNENFLIKNMPRKLRIGIVVSITANKTVIANVQTRYQHPLYSKTILRIKRYMIHDPNNICFVGDKILIEETRPFSLNKYWILKSILQINR